MTTQNKVSINLDVQVSLTALTSAVATDMTKQCFLTKNIDLLHGSRYVILSSSDVILTYTTAGTSLYYAMQSFFKMTNRPDSIVVAKVFEDNQPAYLLSGNVDLADLTGVNNGAFKIIIDGEERAVSALDLAGATTLEQLATILNTAMTAYATVSVFNGLLLIQSKTTGAASSIGYATSPDESEEVTDVSSLLALTEATGAEAFQGYVAGTIAEEAQNIADQLDAGGTFCYGWSMDADFRDTPDQFAFAEWINARSYRAQAAFMSNNVTAYSATSTTDLGAKCLAANMSNVACFYCDNPQYFYDVEYLATAQAVNYNTADSTINLKFKESGSPATNFPNINTNLAVLKSKRINTVTGYKGQNINIFREGTNSSSYWYTDTWVDICNLINELQIAYLNVFLRNNKITYTEAGQNKFLSAATQICDKYVTNGALADRIIEDKTAQNGVGLSPAYTIDIQSLETVTDAQRAAREGTDTTIYLNPSNAMNSIAINLIAQ